MYGAVSGLKTTCATYTGGISVHFCTIHNTVHPLIRTQIYLPLYNFLMKKYWGCVSPNAPCPFLKSSIKIMQGKEQVPRRGETTHVPSIEMVKTWFIFLRVCNCVTESIVDIQRATA